jgi:hypothetical protein
VTSVNPLGRGGVDVGAEESLAEDREDTALGLLSSVGADVDEVVGGVRSSGSCTIG